MFVHGCQCARRDGTCYDVGETSDNAEAMSLKQRGGGSISGVETVYLYLQEGRQDLSALRQANCG